MAQKMKPSIAFYRQHGSKWLTRPIGTFITVVTIQRMVHAELVDSTGQCFSSSALDGGVRTKKIDLSGDHWHVMPVPWLTDAAIHQHYQNTQGQKYDHGAIWGHQFLKLPAKWTQSPDKWFCSEWCAAPLGYEHSAQIDPGELHEKLAMDIARYHAYGPESDGPWNERLMHML